MPEFVNTAFRAAFPEFADTVKYSDPIITFWATFAQAQVNWCRWGSQALNGTYLYVAHELVLAAQNQKTAIVGGAPGGQAGAATSKTVGSVTAQYDAQTTTERSGGWWNLTSYGKQFLRLARCYGAGAIQL
jgi:hypothetical protein